jgi:CDP-paratose 2-epimerase
MSIVVVTGSAGLVGSESCRHFHALGHDVVGVDNDMRSYFFGQASSVNWNRDRLIAELPRYKHHSFDIRDPKAVGDLFGSLKDRVKLVIHTAAQPSHDWAAREPLTDFTINANGTMTLLEAVRQHCPEAVFIFTSTNKVYGDTPNRLPLVERETRWEVDPAHAFAAHGIDESMSIDGSTHSLFGVSKAAADLLVQEYGRYFGLRTGVFRGGCLTGPSHSPSELHGFLAYLVLCAVRGKPYTIYGYKGKQVRDNIHSHDLVRAFEAFFQSPKPGAVYNMGGSRHANVSMLEAITIIEKLCAKKLTYSVSDQNRVGDHIWYVSDVRAFQRDYPQWKYTYDIPRTLEEMVRVAMTGEH